MEIASKFIARSPAFTLTTPTKEELDEVFKKLNPLLITYNVLSESNENAYLYTIDDNDYELEKLDSTGRRFARKGRANFDIKFVDWEVILEQGLKAFCDTRTRNGLDDGTEDVFLKRMTDNKNNPAFKAIAAFSKDENLLAAYLTVIEVEDWVEITSGYSDNNFLKSYPNNGLFDFALSHYLKEHSFQKVSYGVSSIQKKSNKESLHVFKKRVGFKATPIKRVFLPNPKYKFAFNPISRSAVKLMLKLKKGDRNLLKLEGMFDMLEKGGDV
mgnify:CR=1 FL=1